MGRGEVIVKVQGASELGRVDASECEFAVRGCVHVGGVVGDTDNLGRDFVLRLKVVRDCGDGARALDGAARESNGTNTQDAVNSTEALCGIGNADRLLIDG